MAIISRLSRLFQADIHAMLDQLEEPRALLKQSLREMECELATTEQQLTGLKQLQQQQSKALSAARSTLEEMGPQLDLCFAAGDEHLARNLIRRRLELEKHCRRVKTAIDERADAIGTTERLLRERQLHFDSIRQKAELFDAADEEDETHERPYHVSEDDVEVALLAEKQKRQCNPETKGGAAP